MSRRPASASTGSTVMRVLPMFPLSENDNPLVSQPLYQPADQVRRSSGVMPVNRTPALRGTESAEDIVDRSMKERSSLLDRRSSVTPSDWLPIVTFANFPSGIETFRSDRVQPRCPFF